MEQAIKINRPEPYLLYAEWGDGFSATISLEKLRRECPCATCTGEKVGNRVYSKPRTIKVTAGAFELSSLDLVGNYAISVKWVNGHDSGIYTWGKLRQIFEQFEIKTEEEFKKLEIKYNKEKKKIKLKVL